MSEITERSYTTIEKVGWPRRGPWDNEPDKIQWIDADTDLDCLIVRAPTTGSLCDHGRDYADIEVDVHGGLTYSAKCQEGRDEDRGICHVPAPGRSDEVWWLGFDCAHAFDITPAYEGWNGYDAAYRTVRYVRAQVTSLAAQLSGRAAAA